jgi:hypothetical protein
MSLKYNLKDLTTNTHIYFNPNNSEDLDAIKTIIESNDEFTLPNEKDINDNYKNLSEYICRLKENSSVLCKGLSLEYIKDTFETADAIIAISSKGINILPNGNIFSFALINFNENDNSVYIDVICSHIGVKYAGEMLLKSITDICNILHILKIKLNSVSSAISFYERYGFNKKGLCENNEELCEMEKDLSKKSLGGNRRKTKKRQNKKTKKRRKYTKRHSLKSSRV